MTCDSQLITLLVINHRIFVPVWQNPLNVIVPITQTKTHFNWIKITKIQQEWLEQHAGGKWSVPLFWFSGNASAAPFELRSCRSQIFGCDVTGWSVLNRSHSQSIKGGKLHSHRLDVCDSRLKDRHTNVCVTPVHVANSITPPHCLVLKLRLSYGSDGFTLVSSSGTFMFRV